MTHGFLVCLVLPLGPQLHILLRARYRRPAPVLESPTSDDTFPDDTYDVNFERSLLRSLFERSHVKSLFRCHSRVTSSDVAFGIKFYRSFLVSLFETSLTSDITFLEEKLMKWIRRKNMSVFTFTVISQQHFSKALDLGVDGIIMDDPYLN